MQNTLYNLQNQDLTAYLRAIQKQNAETTTTNFQKTLSCIDALFDIQHKIASIFFDALYVQEKLYRNVSQSQQLLFSAYHKNTFSLFAALELTRVGMHGSAKANLRHAFEALMIAKFCSLAVNQKVLERWVSGKHISLGAGILRNIDEPNPEPFWTLWGTLSDYSHATIYAQQVSLQVENEVKEIDLNLVLLQVLLECNYHLLNSYFATPKLRYYAEVYGDGKTLTIPALRQEARIIFRGTRAHLGERSVKLITAYKRKWVLKN